MKRPKNINTVKTGKFICQIRKEMGLVQQDIANFTGASYKSVSKWENGDGFPSREYQQKLCNCLHITLEELLNGEYNHDQRKEVKHNDTFKKVVYIAVAVLVPIIVFLATYFTMTYKSLKIYSLTSEESKYFDIQGVLVRTNKFSVIYIGNVLILDDTINNSKISSVDLYSNGSSFYHSSVNSSITIKSDNSKINPDNLYIRYIIDDNIYETKLSSTNFVEKMELQENESEEETKILSNEEIINNLKKDGFKQTDSDNWTKKINNKTVLLCEIPYSMFSYTSNSKNIIKQITYFFTQNIVEVSIFENNKDIHTLLENYTYNINTKELNCETGSCSSLDDALKIVEKYSYLFERE